MYYLYHIWLSAPSRAVRIALGEYKQAFELLVEKPWERRKEFLALNPSGSLPVLYDTEARASLCDMIPILEFLDENSTPPSLFGDDVWAR
ncbi:MAG: glutathione S-transferase N-terminal domain-containing protein, partial [Pseudomonadota bacterium]